MKSSIRYNKAEGTFHKVKDLVKEIAGKPGDNSKSEAGCTGEKEKP